MANKREFKKYINTVSDNIISDMTYACYSVKDANKDLIEQAVIEVLKAGATAIMKSNVKFDKTRRAFDNQHDYLKAKDSFFHNMYRTINKEFAAAVNDAVKKFNSAVPAAVKEAQKA